MNLKCNLIASQKLLNDESQLDDDKHMMSAGIGHKKNLSFSYL